MRKCGPLRAHKCGRQAPRLTVTRGIMAGRHWQLAVLSRASRRTVTIISSGRVVAATLQTRRRCAVVNGLLECAERKEKLVSICQHFVSVLLELF